MTDAKPIICIVCGNELQLKKEKADSKTIAYFSAICPVCGAGIVNQHYVFRRVECD